MDLDTLYIMSENEVYQNIKSLVRRNSVSLALYSTGINSERFVIKKNLMAIKGLLKEDGVLAISCFYENISSILSIIRDEYICLDPGVLIISTEQQTNPSIIHNHSIYITCSKIKTNGIFIDNDGVNNPNESIVNRLSKMSEVVLFIGDRSLDGAIFAKQMCRSVICFADTGYDKLENESVIIK